MAIVVLGLVSLALLGGPPSIGRRVAPRAALRAAIPADAERLLGSMENLFAPRRAAGSSVQPTPHVMCAVVRTRLDDGALRAALAHALEMQPMLSRRIVGSGAPAVRTRIGSLKAPALVASVLPFLRDEDMVRVGDPDPLRFAPMAHSREMVGEAALRVVDVPGGDAALDAEWRRRFADELNLVDGAPAALDVGPLWRLTALRGETRTALLFAFNHAISDQASANALLDQMLRAAAGVPPSEAGAVAATADPPAAHAALAPSLEEVILGTRRSVGFVGEETGGSGLLGLEHGSAAYVRAKLSEPAAGELARGTPPPWAGSAREPFASRARRSAPEFRTVGAPALAALRARCREAGVSVSFALAAAAALSAAELARECAAPAAPLKLLLSLDMRAFGKDGAAVHGGAAAGERTAERLSCQAGSMDLMLTTAAADAAALGGAAAADRAAALPAARRAWALARAAKAQLDTFVASGYAFDSVLVFDWAMRSFEMTRLVELEADNPLSLGRAYGAALTNAGVYRPRQADQAQTRPQAQAQTQRKAQAPAAPVAAEVEALHFAVPHARTGALLPFSAATTPDGVLHVTLNAAEPLVDAAARAAAADRFVQIVEALASAELAPAATPPGALARNGGALASGAIALGCAALALPHIGAWGEWFDAWRRVVDAGAMDADWAPLKFWAFFAAMHPLLQPALWISEVLHAPVWPGPLLGGLVPASFALANVVVLGALGSSARLRNSLNALLAAAALGYISTGLAGTGSTSAYNLALDDGIRGCPAYEEVVQPSMRDFDVRKYQGRWYELGFHDWTQFQEVYSTTLDIELSKDGSRWVDDFGVKGPAPLVAARSWDKSPVANGAHYFLYGKMDKATPGILQESGFGLTFPNFIVDVQKDAKGEYTQAIQFQCLERGGVRIFEGINFLSRTTDNQDAQMASMHEVATKAGMDPYGSAVGSMHVVQQSPPGSPPVDNIWQRTWDRVGFGKLLALAEGAMHSQAEDILNPVN